MTSLLGFLGCAQPQPKPGATTAPVATTTSAPAETPDVAETPEATATAAATPGATGTPAADATPSATGTPVAASGAGGAVLEDFENADGMEGYEEVAKLEVVASTPETVAKGKELFAANCATCHGDTGAGDGPAGAALDPPPRNLATASEYKYGSMELGIYRTVYYGVEGTGMAPLADALDDPVNDTWALVHFVRSIQK